MIQRFPIAATALAWVRTGSPKTRHLASLRGWLPLDLPVGFVDAELFQGLNPLAAVRDGLLELHEEAEGVRLFALVDLRVAHVLDLARSMRRGGAVGNFELRVTVADPEPDLVDRDAGIREARRVQIEGLRAKARDALAELGADVPS